MNRWSLRSLLVLIFSSLLSTVVVAQQSSSPNSSGLTSQSIVALSIKGRSITIEEANRLEEMLVKDPSDLASRFTLISYYSTNFRDKGMRAKKCEHVLWTIENVPGSPLLKYAVQGRLNRMDQCFVQGQELWLKQVEVSNGNLNVLRNAIGFFMVPDNEIAEKLIKQGAIAEPQNPEWPRQLGTLYSLQMNTAKGEERQQFAKDAYVQYEQAVKLSTNDQSRRLLRLDLARTAFESSDTKTAESLAAALVAEAEQEKSAGFRTDLIHGAHSILGRVALQNGDVVAAIRHLKAAGEVEGSPVLNSFGPGMMLAKELLDKGERDAVLDYFLLISSFWKNEKLQNWTVLVKGGGVPDFGGNLSR